MSTVSNRSRLFLASFINLVAAGIGFSIRASILDEWAGAFGFTKSELGAITGMGLVGFGVTIIGFSTIADRLGYRFLMRLGFTLHASSALITWLATPLFAAFGKSAAYYALNIGVFTFALGNGTSEAVINPLTATLYPERKTHYLNVLHAGWPGGLVVGALLAAAMKGNTSWEVQLGMFLLPTIAYGALMLTQTFPPSETHAAGVTFSDMLKSAMAPLFFVLIGLHALVGYVELGTDSWVSQITGAILADPKLGLYLFVYTSLLMFALRFVAGPIVHRISSLGLLATSAVIGALGLLWLSSAQTGLACVAAATVYGIGKTFLWPTMLGVASERFPRTGSLGMGLLGGIGMISAGLLGTPGIGYKQDYFASQHLEKADAALYQKLASQEKRSFLVFPAIAGLDGSKVEALTGKPVAELSADEKTARTLVEDAGLFGGRMALRYTAIVPAMMAAGYIFLMLVFARRRRDA